MMQIRPSEPVYRKVKNRWVEVNPLAVKFSGTPLAAAPLERMVRRLRETDF